MIAPSVAGLAPNLAICAAGSPFAIPLTTLNVFLSTNIPSLLARSSIGVAATARLDLITARPSDVPARVSNERLDWHGVLHFEWRCWIAGHSALIRFVIAGPTASSLPVDVYIRENTDLDGQQVWLRIQR